MGSLTAHKCVTGRQPLDSPPAQGAGASKQVVEGNLLPEMEKSCSQLSMSPFITFTLKLLLI